MSVYAVVVKEICDLAGVKIDTVESTTNLYHDLGFEEIDMDQLSLILETSFGEMQLPEGSFDFGKERVLSPQEAQATGEQVSNPANVTIGDVAQAVQQQLTPAVDLKFTSIACDTLGFPAEHLTDNFVPKEQGVSSLYVLEFWNALMNGFDMDFPEDIISETSNLGGTRRWVTDMVIDSLNKPSTPAVG